MRPSNKTSMGGGKSVFQTTRWSEILRAKTDDQALRRMIIGKLMTTYWKPVYCYLRHKGHTNETAKDLTQGFFHEIVLGRELIQQADKTKGRFRTFLLTALERYVVDVYRGDTRKKNRPKAGFVRLEFAELVNLPPAKVGVTPEQAFYYGWAADLLDQVLAEVKDEYCSTGRAKHWEVFRLKVLVPIFEDVKGPSLAEICRKYGIADESKASNMIITVKRRFRAVLKRHLRGLVRSDLEVEEEFRDFVKILSDSGAG